MEWSWKTVTMQYNIDAEEELTNLLRQEISKAVINEIIKLPHREKGEA